MNRELIINSGSEGVDIALLEDKKLVELQKDKSDSGFAVGDIYLGRVKKISPALNAAFIDIGYEKDAFLHYFDLGPQIKSLIKYTKYISSGKIRQYSIDGFPKERDIEKTGKISNVLTPNQQIVVQVAKEPILTKGPRITSEISLAGRFLVLMPFSDRISVSQKIKNAEERNRLKRLITSIRPKGFGIIIRTVAENKMVAELDADLKQLFQQWETLSEKLVSLKPPKKIISEINKTSVILRDILNDSFNSIYVNEPNLYEEIKDYILKIYPDKADIVKMYKSKQPIYEYFGIEKQIKTLFGKIVTFKGGSYLIIEHTEAMHVIDVNSGNRMKLEISQEENALEVNLEAANEIARQLRLRDMGGIIVIDFIDMVDGKNRKKLYDRMKDVMKYDRAKHSILPPSKFGLIQITRQRTRPELNIDTVEKCPVCGGSGEIKASITLIDEIEHKVRYLLREQNEQYIAMATHPFIHAFLIKGFPSVRFKWYLKYKKWIKIRPMASYHFLQYRFFNKNDDEIKI